MRNTYGVPEEVTQLIEEYVPINKRIRKFNVHHTLCMVAILQARNDTRFFKHGNNKHGNKLFQEYWQSRRKKYTEARAEARRLERLRKLGATFPQSPYSPAYWLGRDVEYFIDTVKKFPLDLKRENLFEKTKNLCSLLFNRDVVFDFVHETLINEQKFNRQCSNPPCNSESSA